MPTIMTECQDTVLSYSLTVVGGTMVGPFILGNDQVIVPIDITLETDYQMQLTATDQYTVSFQAPPFTLTVGCPLTAANIVMLDVRPDFYNFSVPIGSEI